MFLIPSYWFQISLENENTTIAWLWLTAFLQACFLLIMYNVVFANNKNDNNYQTTRSKGVVNIDGGFIASLVGFLIGVVVYHVLAILFGAPFIM